MAERKKHSGQAMGKLAKKKVNAPKVTSRKTPSTVELHRLRAQLEHQAAELQLANERFQSNATERNRVEKALRESEERFNRLAQASLEGIAIHEKGRILDANQVFIDLFGYELSEIIGMNVLDLATPESRDLVRNNFLMGYEKPYEAMGLRKDGTVFVGELRGKSISYHGRTVRVTVVRDITERKQAEKALRRNEEKFKELFEEAPFGYHEVDELGNICAVNRAELKMLGFTKEEMIGMPAWKDISDSEEARKRVLGKLAGNVPPNKNSERIVVRKDGTSFPALIDDVILRDEQGKINGIRTALLDITDRKLVEEALAKEQFLMNMLMDNVPDHIYFKDKESRFIRMNKSHAASFRLGDPAEAVGKTDFDFFAEQHARPAFEDEQKIMKTGQPLIGLEEKETWPDGSETWVTTTKMPLRDREGEIIGTFGISKDITKRKKAEEALQKTSEEREKLIKELQYALENIKTLQGLIPICASCKKIRDDKGYWGQVEEYILSHSSAKLSHGICPDCAKKLYGDLYEKAIKKNLSEGNV
ncbi:MAG: PAS domain S-box protein [Bacteroidota bacterium]